MREETTRQKASPDPAMTASSKAVVRTQTLVKSFSNISVKRGSPGASAHLGHLAS